MSSLVFGPGLVEVSHCSPLIAIEVYPHAAFAPYELAHGGILFDRQDCGLVLMWTTGYLRVP
jgi:hypothetical protein